MYKFTNIIINMNNNININSPMHTNPKYSNTKMISQRNITRNEHVLWKPYNCDMYKDYVVVSVIKKNENEVVYCITPNNNYDLTSGVKDVYQNVYVSRDELV